MPQPTSFDRSIFLSKALYFLFFSAVGALMPFLVLYYEQLGLTGRQIGLLTGVAPLVTMLSATFWGGLADATRQHQNILTGTLIGATLTAPFFLTTAQLLWLLGLVIIFGCFTAPIMPLIDNAVLGFLGSQSRRYGKVRLWGAIGFGVSPPIVGVFVEQGGIKWAFMVYLGLILSCILLSRLLPISPAESADQTSDEPDIDKPSKSETRQPTGSFWQDFRTLMQDRAWVLLLSVVFISGMSSAVMHNYLFLYMNHIGSGEGLMGLALSVAMVGEISMFVFSERLLNRFQTHQLLMLAMLGHAIRLVLYSYISLPWLVLPVQVLHGFSFALIWITAVEYARKIAPPGMGATAQGILNSVNFGIASAVGSLAGGYLYQQVGPFLMFRWAGLWVLLGVALLANVNSRTRRAARRVV